jgi:hypothetical protein
LAALARLLPKAQITLFDRKVMLSRPFKRAGHERPFADLIEVEDLHYNVVRGLSQAEMAACVSALMAHTESSATLEGAVQAFVYTTDERASRTTLSLAKTHAFSVLTGQGDRLAHHYFEKQNGPVFHQVPSLSMPLSGPLDMDDVRLLHFAGTGQRGLALSSTIYELNAGAWAARDWAWEKNVPLRVAILTDPGRNSGAPTLGLYGDEIYLAFLNVSGSYCGGNRDCPKGKDTCGDAPGGPDPVCGAVSIGGNLFVDLARAFREQDVVSPVPIDFSFLRSLRKNFFERYEQANQYVSHYYIFSLFAKLDRGLLEQYAQAMPSLDQGMRALAGSDEAVVVTTPLRDAMLDLIGMHRDVENRAFQETLDALERDLASFHGLTKRELIDALSG